MNIAKKTKFHPYVDRQYPAILSENIQCLHASVCVWVCNIQSDSTSFISHNFLIYIYRYFVVYGSCNPLLCKLLKDSYITDLCHRIRITYFPCQLIRTHYTCIITCHKTVDKSCCHNNNRGVLCCHVMSTFSRCMLHLLALHSIRNTT